MKLSSLFLYFVFLFIKTDLNGQSISGEVIGSDCKESIPFATIHLYKSGILVTNEFSDIDGKFKFKNLSSGAYQLILKYVGCKTDTLTIVIEKQNIMDVKFLLKCTPIICSDVIFKEDYPDFDSISVAQYIEKLRIKNRNHNAPYEIKIDKKAKIDWIKKEDVKYMMTLIASTERAKCVWQDISSKLPHPDKSTFGGQVMNLIDCFRLGVSYPNFLTDCSATDENRILELKKWWESVK